MNSRAAIVTAAVNGVLGATIKQAIGDASAQVTLAAGGVYRVCPDTDCCVLQSSDVDADATGADCFLPAGGAIYLTAGPVEPANHGVPAAAIYLNVIGTAGYLYVTRVLPDMTH